MASGKKTSVFWTSIVIVIFTIGVGSRLYRVKQNNDYKKEVERRQIYKQAEVERQRAEIQDKVFTPDATSDETKMVETVTVPDTPSAPATAPVVPEAFKDIVQSNKDVPEVLSPFLQFIGHVHVGRRYVVGPTPSVSLDSKRFGMFDMADRHDEYGIVRFVVSDIEYTEDPDIHHGSGLDMDDALSLHKRNSVELGVTTVKNILHLSALDDGSWFWLKGNLYQKSEYNETLFKEPATCWFKWTGQDGDAPIKTCLESSQESGDLHSVQISQNGAVGVFTQKTKTKDVEGPYNTTVPFLTYRLIAVDLHTGQLMAESPVSPSTEKDVELGAFFLEPKGTRAIISESIKQARGTKGSVNFYNWDIAENKIIGKTQTVITNKTTRRTNDPTKIDALFAAPDGQTISLMYNKGAGQVIFDAKSGAIKSFHNSSDYAFSAGEGATPKAGSGFPLANGNVLFVVRDRHSNVSWQVFDQTRKGILGQKSKMSQGLKLSYPVGKIAMTKYSDMFHIYEVQD